RVSAPCSPSTILLAGSARYPRVPIVYASAFGVTASGSVPPEVGNLVSAAVKEWAEDGYQRRGTPAIFLSTDGQIEMNGEPVGALTSHREIGNGLGLWTLDFAYADTKDATLLWDASCTVAHSPTETEFSCVLR